MVEWTARNSPFGKLMTSFRREHGMASRLRLSGAAKVLAAVVIIAAASRRLPHLVLTQAVTSTLLPLVVAPLWLLGRPESGPGSRPPMRDSAVSAVCTHT